GADQGGQDVHHGGFPGAVRAEQREDRPLGDGEVDVIEHYLVAKRLPQPGDRNRGQGGGHGGHLSSFQERRITMSPYLVRALTSTVWSEGPGPSDESSWLWIRPNCVWTSSRAAVPASMPTSISPRLVLSEAEPRVIPPTRTSPLA